MKKRQIGGSIVMISSVGDVMSQSNPYATSKSALSHLVRGFARENIPFVSVVMEFLLVKQCQILMEQQHHLRKTEIYVGTMV